MVYVNGKEIKVSKPRLFLQSTVVPENRFEILRYDKETKIARLKGKYAEFDEELSDEKLEKNHYVIEKEKQDEAN